MRKGIRKVISGILALALALAACFGIAAPVNAGIVGNATTLVAQAADLTTTTAYAVPTGGGGVYRVTAYIQVTRVATTSSTMPAVTIGWTDPDASQAQMLAITTAASDNLLTDFSQGTVTVKAKAGTNITFSTATYASSGATAMQFSLAVRVEAM